MLKDPHKASCDDIIPCFHDPIVIRHPQGVSHEGNPSVIHANIVAAAFHCAPGPSKILLGMITIFVFITGHQVPRLSNEQQSTLTAWMKKAIEQTPAHL